MADLDAIVVWTKQLLNKPVTTAADDTGAPNNAIIKAAINYERNMAYARFAAQFPARFAASTDVTYTGQGLSQVLPAGVQNRQIVTCFAYDVDIGTPWALSVRNVAELANLGGTGTPNAYAVSGTSIYLRPVPGADVTLRVIYIPVLTALSAGSDVPSEFPADFHLTLGTMAARLIRRRNRDPEAEELDVMCKEALELLQDTMRAMVQDDAWVQSAPRSPFDQGSQW